MEGKSSRIELHSGNASLSGVHEGSVDRRSRVAAAAARCNKVEVEGWKILDRSPLSASAMMDAVSQPKSRCVSLSMPKRGKKDRRLDDSDNTFNNSPAHSPPQLKSIMLRASRPLLQQALKSTTGITGLKVHPNPLPTLVSTYQETLARVSEIPSSSVYRQSVEALTQRKLKLVQNANGDVAAAEKALDDGQIEEAIDVAQDELSLVAKMIDWKAYVSPSYCTDY